MDLGVMAKIQEKAKVNVERIEFMKGDFRVKVDSSTDTWVLVEHKIAHWTTNSTNRFS